MLLSRQTSIKIFLCVMALLLLRATAPSFFRRVFEDKDACEKQQQNLIGLWMITPDGLNALVNLGYKTFTNQTDHMLLLNPDGTCVFTSFSEYLCPFHRDPSDEYWSHEGFLGEGTSMWPKGLHYSWYVSDPEKTAIRGPYFTTNIVLGASEQLHKNRMTHWTVLSRWAWEEWMRDEDSNLGVKCKWHLRITHPNFSKRTFFHITENDSGVALWRSSIRRNWYGEKIYFQRFEGL